MAIFNKEYLLLLDENAKKDTNEIKSYIIVFYKHCIKYYHQKDKQDHSWIDSIFNGSRGCFNTIYDYDKKKYNANKLKLSSNIIYDAYINSIAEAEGEVNFKIEDNNYIFNLFPTVEDIMNIDNVISWMIENAKDNKIKDYIMNHN